MLYDFFSPIEVEGGPDNDVGQEQGRDGHEVDGDDVDHDKGQREADDAHHGLAVAEAHVEELVVDVVAVWQERAAAAAYAVDEDPDDIEHGNQQERESQDDGTGQPGVLDGIGHAETDAQNAEQEADGQRAGVAHEELAAAAGLAEDVAMEERDEDAQRGEAEERMQPVAQVGEEEAERQKGDAAQAGGQTVDAIDEVDGIEDEDDGQDRERKADPQGEGMDAEQTVEVVEIEAGKGDEDAADQLYEEFGPVADADEVVHQATEEQDEQRAADGEHFERQDPAQHGSADQLVVEQDGHEQSDGDAGEKGQAAQAGHIALVELASVVRIEQATAGGHQGDAGQDEAATHQTRNERKGCAQVECRGCIHRYLLKGIASIERSGRIRG